MICIRTFGRRLIPRRADLGLTHDRAAETVRFIISPPRDEVFDTPGMRAHVLWIAPGGACGRSALTLRHMDGALMGDWVPPPEAMLREGALRAELRCAVLDDWVWHSQPLALRLKKSIEQEQRERARALWYRDVNIDVTPLPAGSEPAVIVRQLAERIDCYVGIPGHDGMPRKG